jgi:IPT/TIG domain
VLVEAKTGKIHVTTPSGTLRRNVAFRITPQITTFTPTCDAMGTSVTITGTELTQISQVTFGGVQATTFTDSDWKCQEMYRQEQRRAGLLSLLRGHRL